VTSNDTIPEIDINALRRKLIAEYVTSGERRKAYFDVLRPGNADATRADWDAYMALAGTGTYAWLVSGILRLLEQKHPETAVNVAAWVELMLDSGTDWLEDLNNDLPDEAFTSVDATTEGI